jgi:hypothetical protein
MPPIYANSLEQLDLALEQVGKGDPYSARFALMLTDNVIELMIHQIAETASKQLVGHDLRSRREIPLDYPHRSTLKKALGQSFPSKVSFAQLTGRLTDEQATSVLILHKTRNELYHLGARDDDLLPHLARFYLAFTCDILRHYEPPQHWYQPHIADRIKTFFKKGKPEELSDYYRAFKAIRDRSEHRSATLIENIAQKIQRIADSIDEMLRCVSRWNEISIEEAVIYCQYSAPEASSEMDELAAKKFRGPAEDRDDWIRRNYPFKFRASPTPKWRELAGRLHAEDNPHVALKEYDKLTEDKSDFIEGVGRELDKIQDILANDEDRDWDDE